MQVNPWVVGPHDILTALGPQRQKALNAAEEAGVPDSMDNTG